MHRQRSGRLTLGAAAHSRETITYGSVQPTAPVVVAGVHHQGATTIENLRSGGLGVSLNDVTVVTVSYGNPKMVRDMLQSVLAAGVAHVVVWDNTQDADEASAIARLASDRVTVEGTGENVGFSRGCNAGAAKANTPLLLFLNPDCVTRAHDLESCRQLLLADATHGVVAPRMTYADGREGIAGGSGPSLSKELLAATGIDDLLPRPLRSRLMTVFEAIFIRGELGTMGQTMTVGDPLPVAWVSGFCMMMRADTFSSVEGFDPRFFLYFEDADLCFRIRARGMNVLVNRAASVEHAESSSMGSKKTMYYWEGFARYWDARGSCLKALVARLVQKMASGKS